MTYLSLRLTGGLQVILMAVVTSFTSAVAALAFNAVLAAVVTDRTVALLVATHGDSIPLFLMATLHSIRALPPT